MEPREPRIYSAEEARELREHTRARGVRQLRRGVDRPPCRRARPARVRSLPFNGRPSRATPRRQRPRRLRRPPREDNFDEAAEEEAENYFNPDLTDDIDDEEEGI